MAEVFTQMYAVTDHAIARYCERVEPGATRERAIRELLRALQAPAFERPDPKRPGATLHGCRDRLGRRIGVVTVHNPGPGREWPVVITVGGWLLWQEAKAEWEAMYAAARWPSRS